MLDQDSLADVVLSLPQAFRLACKLSGSIEVHATHRGTKAEHTFSVNSPFAIVGRAPTAGVRLDDPSVSQIHAILQIVEGVPYCVDLGSRTGVVWDDGTQGRGWVTRGQVLRIGAFDVTVQYPTADDPPFTSKHPEVESGGEADLPPAAFEIHPTNGSTGTVFPLDRPVTLIGRHPNCQLRLLDETINYFHGCVVNTPGGLWWVDILGRQGSRLNGRPARLARLRDGDLIELGKVSLVLRTGEPAESLVVGGGQGLMVRTQPIAAGFPPPDMQDNGLAPLREVMGQFQQCLTTMAGMFTAMQQEHVSMMCEQMRHVQDLTRELRELRKEMKAEQPARTATPEPVPLVTAPQAAAPPTPPTHPTPQVSAPADKAALTDAHTWFLSQLAKFGQPPVAPQAKPHG